MCTEPVILHGTDDWLVVNKPARWHSVAGKRDDDEATVESWLRAHVTTSVDLHEAGLVHRLDYWTGGCLLVATNEAARVELREAMSGRGEYADAIRKVYLAQVGGMPPEHGHFELAFTSRYKRSKKVTVAPTGSGKTMGRCQWHHAREGVMEIELIGPGRRHQIRAGLAHLGWPLVGDALYGGPPADGPRLHAWRLWVGDDVVESPRPSWAIRGVR